MTNYKTVASVFVVLTVIFGAATGYLLASPPTTTKATTSTVFTTTTQMAESSPAYTVNIAYAPSIGFYLTNATGFTLYFRSTDTPSSGTTTCTSSTCEKNWPVFYSSALVLPPGLSASSFSTITAYNSTKILTYDGYPLFYWVHDAKAREATGQRVGGIYACTVPAPVVPSTTTTTT